MATLDYKAKIIEALDVMRTGQLAIKEATSRFKANAYKKAIDAFRAHEGPITTIADIKDLEGIGKQIREKVVEIISTGGLAAAERVKATTDIGAFEVLIGIHGIGPVKARNLIELGITNIADLRVATLANPKLLTKAQSLGLKYASTERIPRAEMEDHEKQLLALLPAPLRGAIVGSYRRGAINSGDIDLIVTYPSTEKEGVEGKKAFGLLIETLVASGYVKDELVSGAHKWMGYAALPGASVRRLDIMLTTPDEYGYAILYFTGSDKFNIAFRRYAQSKGYTLNEHTLASAASNKVMPIPTVRCEEDIFAFLGLKYVPPYERIDGRQIIPL